LTFEIGGAMRGWSAVIGLALLAGMIAAGCCPKAPPQTQPSPAPMRTEATTQPGSLLFPNDILNGKRPQSVAFVCDASESMAPKMWSLKRELRKAVLALSPDQQFSITFFQNDGPATLAPTLLPATAENKHRAEVFLLGVTSTGSPDPIPGIRLALKQRPQVMYLLADGDFPDNDHVLRMIENLDGHHATEIRTIAFVGDDDHDVEIYKVLKQIADETEGGFKKVFVEARDESNAINIAYVCDTSESMAPKLACLKDQLFKAINGLHPDQQFSIIFMQSGQPQSLKMTDATPENKRRARDFLQSIQPYGTTDPIPALESAFSQRPDLIYLLTDRDFPDDPGVLNEVHKLNGSYRAKIDTIAFVGPDPDDHDPNMIQMLEGLANESGGMFKAVNYRALPEASQ
jgi:hypothetical protein